MELQCVRQVRAGKDGRGRSFGDVEVRDNVFLLKAWAAIGTGGAGASKVSADPTGMVIDMIEQTISKLTGSDPEGAAIAWLTNDLLHYQARLLPRVPTDSPASP